MFNWLKINKNYILKRKVRIVARIDLNNAQLVKGKLLEGLRKLGDPRIYLKKYYNEMIDEIILLDSVASLYDRNALTNIINIIL
mgnify:CR=1 FL=1